MTITEQAAGVVREARREEWLAVKELAAFWGVSPRTVYRMLAAHELPTARRVRGQWRILRTAPPRADIADMTR